MKSLLVRARREGKINSQSLPMCAPGFYGLRKINNPRPKSKLTKAIIMDASLQLLEMLLHLAISPGTKKMDGARLAQTPWAHRQRHTDGVATAIPVFIDYFS